MQRLQRWITRKRGKRKSRFCGDNFIKRDPRVKEPGWDEMDRQDVLSFWILGRRK